MKTPKDGLPEFPEIIFINRRFKIRTYNKRK